MAKDARAGPGAQRCQHGLTAGTRSPALRMCLQLGARRGREGGPGESLLIYFWPWHSPWGGGSPGSWDRWCSWEPAVSLQPLPPARKDWICHPPRKRRGERALENLSPSWAMGAGLQGQEPGPGFSFLSLCTAPLPLALGPAPCKFKFCLLPHPPHEASPDHPHLFLLPFLRLGPAAPSLSPKIWAMSPPGSQFFPPSPTPITEMAGVCLASEQHLLCFWVHLAPLPECPGPCSALLERDRLLSLGTP